ncbi:unnamed protein product [Orchesella dallaii]|uniref:Carboxylic ester hydrolase n=1 Tax=Orchesella dallaii TaxID=48710 RepID=A0ABP1RNI2_9HEXA
MWEYFIHFKFGILLYSALVVSGAVENCKVKILNGTIIGRCVGTTNANKKVCAYSAIPYALAPIKELRFKKVDSQSSGNLPVMIWFHGGAFTVGSSLAYTPTKLLGRGDIVLVVVHYRLGTLGFLSTGDEFSPGNYGLKDQAQSIRWVNENIHAFGGNPNLVTIFGESAGGASVIYQLLTPLNKGLIHGAIAQSGTALSHWAIDKTPLTSAKTIAKRLACPVNSSAKLVNCLREKKWEAIVAEQRKFTNDCYSNMTYAVATMTPVVEPILPGAFITEEPVNIMKNGDMSNVPIMIGATKHDGSFILANLYLAKLGPEKLDENPDYMRVELIPNLLRFFRVTEDEADKDVSATVQLAYFPEVNRSSWNDTMPGLVDFISVFAFKSAIQNTADLLSKRNLSVFLYSFEHHSQNTLWPFFFNFKSVPVSSGIAHADDLMYLFDLPAKFSTEDQIFSEIVCDLWLNFSKFGNPTPSRDSRFEQWPTYNVEDESFMKLNITPTALRGYRTSWRPNGFEPS